MTTSPRGIAGVVLAAGASRRLGVPKQLAKIENETLVHMAVRTISASRCSAVAIVVGSDADAVAAAVADLSPIVLVNDAWPEGIASSIRAAAAWAIARGCDGLLLAVCDQPLLTSAHLDALIDRFSAEKRPVGSGYAEVTGVPAVFGRAEFLHLMALQGDRGAGALLRAGAAAVAWPDGAVDVDTAEQLAAARAAGSPLRE